MDTRLGSGHDLGLSHKHSLEGQMDLHSNPQLGHGVAL